jgi:hypothetical protein
MAIRIIDNRTTYKTEKCDAVIEQEKSHNDSASFIIKGFESQEIQIVIDYAKRLKEDTVIYLYDINSKPLK